MVERVAMGELEIAMADDGGVVGRDEEEGVILLGAGGME